MPLSPCAWRFAVDYPWSGPIKQRQCSGSSRIAPSCLLRAIIAVLSRWTIDATATAHAVFASSTTASFSALP
jgi:hypothetical protein